MIRLLLYSQDKKLPLLLGPTLGSEFEVALESNPEKSRNRSGIIAAMLWFWTSIPAPLTSNVLLSTTCILRGCRLS